ncbi:effector-associated constant component EACC1 [Streptomyces sp. NPDC001220]
MDSRVLVEVVGDDDGAVEDLFKWLNLQDALRGRVESVSSPAGPGQMAGGGLTEVLAVALGAGGVGTVLAQALVVWCRQPRGSKVRIRLIASDGRRVEIDGDRVRDADTLIKAVVDLHLDAPPPPAEQAPGTPAIVDGQPTRQADAPGSKPSRGTAEAHEGDVA